MLATALDALITYNPWTLSPATTLAEAARLLDETGISQWPVLNDDGVCLGMLGTAALLAALEQDPSGQSPLARHIDTTAQPLLIGTSPQEALQQLTGRRRMLPVSDGERVVGTISTCDFLRELSYGGPLARELILEYMQRLAETIDADASLAQGLAALSGNQQHLVVVQGDFPLGALSRTSLMQATVQDFARAQRDETLGSRTVGQLLHTCPTIQPGRTLGEAAALMVEHQLDALAVTNQSASLLGLLTEEHLLRALQL